MSLRVPAGRRADPAVDRVIVLKYLEHEPTNGRITEDLVEWERVPRPTNGG